MPSALRPTSPHWLLALGTLCTGCASQAEPVAAGLQAHAIDGSALDTTHVSVGTLNEPGFCTGTLIHPSWVITAGHCAKDGEPLETFLLGPDPEHMTAHALRGREHTQPTSLGKDVALHQLVDPIYDVPKVELRGDVPLDAVCTAVGYGWHEELDGSDTHGTRRSRDFKISHVGSIDFDVDGLLRAGDSGGPLLCDGKLVGIASLAGGKYGKLNPDWIFATIANPQMSNGDPDAEIFIPQQSLLRSSGELCPANTARLQDGVLSIAAPASDDDGDGQVSCQLELAVEVPAGKTFETPMFCTSLYSASELPGLASLAIEAPGSAGFRDDAWHIPRTPTSTRDDPTRCVKVDYQAPTCDDPSQPHSIVFTVDVAVPVAPDSGLIPLGFFTRLSADDTPWSECE